MDQKTQVVQPLINNIDPMIFEYKENPNINLENEIIKKYFYLIKICSSKIRVIGFEQTDLESYGSFGLLDALKKFNCEKNVKFEYYAKKRIFGSIYDFIRKEGIYSRATINNHKLYSEYIELYIEQNQKIPTYPELVNAFGINFINRIKLSKNQIKVSMTDELAESIVDNKPMTDKMYRDTSDKIIDKIINKLNEKEKLIYLLMYHDDYNIADIAELFNLTQASISQSHGVVKKVLEEVQIECHL